MQLIHAYTRGQALEDGELVDAGDLAREAGFNVPVALTRAAWETTVKTNAADAADGQDEQGRLWDVLWMLMARVAHPSAAGSAASRLSFHVSVRHGGVRKIYTLTAVIGPGDDAAPVITLMLPGED